MDTVFPFTFIRVDLAILQVEIFLKYILENLSPLMIFSLNFIVIGAVSDTFLALFTGMVDFIFGSILFMV